MSKNISAEDVAEYLADLKPGYIENVIFKQLSRLMVIATSELVIFRKNQGINEYLMVRRGDEEQFWPGTWHFPGSVMLADDNVNEYQDVAPVHKRILDGELEGKIVLADAPKFFTWERRVTDRGHELTVAFCALYESGELPENAKFMSSDEVKEKIKNDPDFRFFEYNLELLDKADLLVK